VGSALREGWEVRKLGEVCEVLDKLRKPITKKNRIEGNYPYYGATGILSYVHEYIFDEKLVLIGEDGAKWKSGDKTAFSANGKYWVNNHAHVIKPKRTLILDNWIINFLNYSDLTKYITGLTVPKLNQEKMRSIEIPLPPLKEQEKIVTLLDEAFLAIERAKTNAELNLQNAKELFESYLQSVFENRGEGWEETILKNEVDLTTGFAFKSKFYSDKDDDILLIRGDNIMQGSFRWKDAKRWNKAEYTDFEKFQMKENDIVLAMDRPWVKAGLKCARVTKLDLPSLLLQRTARLRNKSSIDNSFLYYLINSKTFTDYLLGVQEGIGVPHISGKQIANYIFNMPPLQEQKNIVKKLNTLQAQTKKLESIYTQKLSDLEELKKSILQKAFNGELI